MPLHREVPKLRESLSKFMMCSGEKCLTLNPSPKGEGLRLDVSSLASGIYFVKVRGEKEERVGKFVKQ